jgi:hypothetical protein
VNRFRKQFEDASRLRLTVPLDSQRVTSCSLLVPLRLESGGRGLRYAGRGGSVETTNTTTIESIAASLKTETERGIASESTTSRGWSRWSK